MKKTLICTIACLTVMVAVLHADAAEKLTLMLDWFPNVDHLPIYVAQEKGYFEEAGLDVKIMSPSDTSDSLKLAMAQTVDLAVGYQPQTVMAAAEGLNPRVVGRLVGHPLTTLLYMKDKGISSPEDLEGKKVGYTVPGMMDLLMAAFAEKNGIESYEAINIGFTIIPALVSGKVNAVMGPFKTYEVVEMKHQGIEAEYFELERHGIPDYDELIFLASPETVEKREGAITAFSDAVQKGIDFARANPKEALNLYFKALPDADRGMETDAFEATLPYFAKNQENDRSRWKAFADFALEAGLIEKAVDISPLLVR
ncbi:ABC transporter substrate-binding protein [Dethiosulfovibrio sp. F2B]|uniref:ABC transporter substrate-binding protein n=1 Tax=Dethiosulfovibrio faecalis TaxID=2720018 RepID=UPI001F39A8C2|nr:ABC transporter substrate-binding protein [Dethiosulfovibrio faecalis]MCF4152044.1 ABC transporter substrate-binding protein [Dethiosulfovibrio faecalis]